MKKGCCLAFLMIFNTFFQFREFSGIHCALFALSYKTLNPLLQSFNLLIQHLLTNKYVCYNFRMDYFAN